MVLHKRMFGLGLFLKGGGFSCWARLRPEDSSGHHVNWICSRGRWQREGPAFSTIMEVMLWLLSVKNEDPKGMHRVLRCEGQGWGQEGALPCGRKEFVYSGVLLVAADCC